MRQRLLLVTLAFLLGLSVGVFALGLKDEPAAVGRALTVATSSEAGPIADGPQAEREESAARVGVGAAQQATTEPVTVGGRRLLADQDPSELAVELRDLRARWASLEDRYTQLSQLLERLQRRLVASQVLSAVDDAVEPESVVEVLPIDTPEARRIALVAAGVDGEDAEALVWRESQLGIERLELQDQAIREGWHRTDRYFEELRALNGDGVSLRAEIGERAYDRYLFRTGETNRVQVSSVMQGSVAEQTGLVPGDIIESYAGARIFNFVDLRNATTEGARDELVPIVVRRGDAMFETSVARGPIGIRLDPAVRAPDA